MFGWLIGLLLLLLELLPAAFSLLVSLLCGVVWLMLGCWFAAAVAAAAVAAAVVVVVVV